MEAPWLSVVCARPVLMWRKDFLRIQRQLSAQGFKILIEIAARLQPQRIAEVPYVFGSRLAGTSKPTAAVALDHLGQLRRLLATARDRKPEPPTPLPSHGIRVSCQQAGIDAQHARADRVPGELPLHPFASAHSHIAPGRRAQPGDGGGDALRAVVDPQAAAVLLAELLF